MRDRDTLFCVVESGRVQAIRREGINTHVRTHKGVCGCMGLGLEVNFNPKPKKSNMHGHKTSNKSSI